MSTDENLTRCWWPGDDAEYIRYHDDEWGNPVVDDTRLFEKICLEGFQSGLSWLTILRKRENFRTAFAGFDINLVAAFNDDDIERLVLDAGIIRHRGKIKSTINNANRALEMQKEFGSLAAYFWSYEEAANTGRPVKITKEVIPSLTPTSTRVSKDLKKRGWSFVGPTTVYAFMQAMGMVNDHVEDCFCREQVEDARAALKRPIKS